MKRIAIDIEANDLYDTVTKVWCLVATDIDTEEQEVLTTPTTRDILEYFKDVELVIGFNIIDYDLPVLTKMFGLKYTGEVFDCYTASCLLNPDRIGGHSLRSWGKRLGFAKGEFNDFTRISEEMIDYCRKDVDLTVKVYEELSDELGLDT